MRYPIKMYAWKAVLVLAMLVNWHSSYGQVINSIAGGGPTFVEGGPATLSSTSLPSLSCFDENGNFYFFQNLSGARIRKINAAGIITTVAGTGSSGYSGDGGPATAAQIKPQGIAVDSAGNIYIADYYNFRLRKVDISTGIIRTIAGIGINASNGDGGPATAAALVPMDVCVDRRGNIFISDNTGQSIRKISPAGVISTVSHVSGLGMCFNKHGKLVFGGGTRIRTLDTATGIIDTVAGTGLAAYNGDGIPAMSANLRVRGLTIDDTGNIYIADEFNNRARKIDTFGIIHTVAGTGVSGFSGDGGNAVSAKISGPEGVAIDPCGNLNIADCQNSRIRKVYFNPVTLPQPTVNITVSPSAIVCTGATVTVTATVAGGGSTMFYQWYKNGVVVSSGPTATMYSYVPANGDSIRCRVSKGNLCGPSYANSNTINMVVNPVVPPVVTIAAAPGSTVCVGTTVTFTPTATGAGSSAAYQWYVNGVAVSAGASYSYNPATGNNIYCRFTSNTCTGVATVNSNTVTMTVTPVITPTITVSTPGSACPGTSVTFTSAVSGAGSSPAYQWYVNGVAAGTGSSYGCVPVAGNTIYCRFTSNTCTGVATVNSNTVTMTVTPVITPTITVSTPGSACPGTSVTFTSVISGAGSSPAYQWYVNGVAAGMGTSYGCVPVAGNTIYCNYTANTCGGVVTVHSNTVTMTVTPVITPTITATASAPGAVCAGTTVSFSATVSGAGITPAYQWFVNGVPAGTTASYAYIPVPGDAVFCRYTSIITCTGPTVVYSNTVMPTVTPTINPTIAVSASPGTTVCAGTTVTFTPVVAGTGTALGYVWFVNGVAAGLSTAYSYIPFPGDAVHCRYTGSNNCGATVIIFSDTVHMTVNPLGYPTVSIIVMPDDTVCKETPVTATAVMAGGSALSYDWLVNGSSTGGTLTSYTYMPADMDSIRCLVTANELCGGVTTTISSNSIIMSVQPFVVPAVSISAPAYALPGATVTVTATVVTPGGYILNWYNNGVLFNTTTTSITTFIKGAGTENIMAEAIPVGEMCYDSSASNMLRVEELDKTSVADVSTGGLHLLPNPAHEEVIVSAPVSLRRVVVSDVLGRVVVEQGCSGTSAVVGLHGLTSGVYVVRCLGIGGTVFVGRVVRSE